MGCQVLSTYRGPPGSYGTQARRTGQTRYSQGPGKDGTRPGVLLGHPHLSPESTLCGVSTVAEQGVVRVGVRERRSGVTPSTQVGEPCPNGLYLPTATVTVGGVGHGSKLSPFSSPAGEESFDHTHSGTPTSVRRDMGWVYLI